MSQAIKLLLTWDIAPAQEEACFAFITQQLPTAMQEAGLELTDAWFTAFGDWPQIRIAFVSPDLKAMEAFLASDSWEQLKRKMLPFTRNYHEKVVAAKGGFQF